jgi:maltose O-acetyltransferase
MKKLLKKISNILSGQQPLDKLIQRGLKVGTNFQRMSNVVIDAAHCWHIEIGNNVTLAPGVHILAHDASTKFFLNYTKVANVKIGSNVFIGAGTIVLPGVNIGDNVIIGAGSVVSKDIIANSVAVGNPANVIYSMDDYLQKIKNEMNSENTFAEEFTLKNKFFNENHKKMMFEAERKFGKIFVE